MFSLTFEFEPPSTVFGYTAHPLQPGGDQIVSCEHLWLHLIHPFIILSLIVHPSAPSLLPPPSPTSACSFCQWRMLMCMLNWCKTFLSTQVCGSNWMHSKVRVDVCVVPVEGSSACALTALECACMHVCQVLRVYIRTYIHECTCCA